MLNSQVRGRRKGFLSFLIPCPQERPTHASYPQDQTPLQLDTHSPTPFHHRENHGTVGMWGGPVRLKNTCLNGIKPFASSRLSRDQPTEERDPTYMQAFSGQVTINTNEYPCVPFPDRAALKVSIVSKTKFRGQ